MYRIVFDPKISKFVVQILRWHLFWVTCCEGEKALTWSTYCDADAWVTDIGLKSAYAQQPQYSLYALSSPR